MSPTGVCTPAVSALCMYNAAPPGRRVHTARTLEAALRGQGLTGNEDPTSDRTGVARVARQTTWRASE